MRPRSLLDEALDRGGRDNVTVIVARYQFPTAGYRQTEIERLHVNACVRAIPLSRPDRRVRFPCLVDSNDESVIHRA